MAEPAPLGPWGSVTKKAKWRDYPFWMVYRSILLGIMVASVGFIPMSRF